MRGYHERAAREIAERAPVRTATPIMRKLVGDSRDMLGRGPADAKQRAAAARQYTIDHLEELHATLREQFARRGIGYHRARTAPEACETVLSLLGDARRVPKSKSMVGEEIGLTHALRAAGIDILETDIGEYIVDIEGRGPSHITAPALHLNRSRIRDLLASTGAELEDDDPTRLSRFVRDVVGAYFRDCDAAITGANAVVASSGRIGIVENEGNVSLGVSHPHKHIVITGIEKVVVDEAAALAVFEVLAPSATAQPLTSFTHFVADPLPGQERHVVFVDNGRSEILTDPRYREVLKCIRCGACMNACPVYRSAGGLSYGSSYMGPIGAVLSPLLWRDGRFSDLPFASSLCGHCTEVCPVNIPLHRMLLDLRADAVESKQQGSMKERIAWRAWAGAFAGQARARTVSIAARAGLRAVQHVAVPKTGGGDGARVAPEPSPHRDQELLRFPGEGAGAEVHVVVESDILVEPDLVALFRERAASLGIAVEPAYTQRAGDRYLRATAAIANTGSVVLTGEATLRRPLLGAARVVVEVAPETIVRYPRDIAPYLGDAEALILTGASRTADIEKQIVRGIHGAEDLVVILAGAEWQPEP